MPNQSRAPLLFSTLLLLLRTFLPDVNGQIGPSEWISRVDSDFPFQDSAMDRISMSSPSNRMWPPSYETSMGGLPRDTLPELYHILAKGQRHPPRLTTGVEVDTSGGERNKRMLHYPVGTGMDLPLEDFAQQTQPGLYAEETFQSPPKSRLKPRQTGIPRYYLFSNLKRNIARDGYMCHFKLCQVGVSGKRLSSMM